MDRRANTINLFKNMGYTIEQDNCVVAIGKWVGGKLFVTFIFQYDLFKTHIVDDVERKINNLIIEDQLKEKGAMQNGNSN